MSHPHSSWHLHYRIHHSSWVQRRALPADVLQRTRTHPRRPKDDQQVINTCNINHPKKGSHSVPDAHDRQGRDHAFAGIV